MSCNNKPFGSKLFILGGDFCQILPVLKNGTERRLIEETQLSVMWPLFEVFKLNTNFRTIDEKFPELLLKKGDGQINNFIIPESGKLQMFFQ